MNDPNISILDTITKDINQKLKEKQLEELQVTDNSGFTESRLLQNIIKRLGEEQKFNDMQSDNEENYNQKLTQSLDYLSYAAD